MNASSSKNEGFGWHIVYTIHILYNNMYLAYWPVGAHSDRKAFFVQKRKKCSQIQCHEFLIFSFFPIISSVLDILKVKKVVFGPFKLIFTSVYSLIWHKSVFLLYKSHENRCQSTYLPTPCSTWIHFFSLFGTLNN